MADSAGINVSQLKRYETNCLPTILGCVA
ncbi:MAG: hypothetical protein ACP5QA_15815 [Phycisphaerae bacterium]